MGVGRRLEVGIVGVIGIALALGGTALVFGENTAQAGDPPSAGSGEGRTVGSGPAQTITLITGDRVDLHSADGRKAVVRPAKGREHIKFVQRRTKGHFYVVPADAVPLVRSGKLDARVFDLLGLVRQGYTDKKSASIPLLVQYAKGRSSAGALRADGISAPKALPVIDGASVKVDKVVVREKRDTWNSLRKASGVQRYWLNGKRKVNLAESVPQIGAPEVWKSGYTGKGVKIAVIDTGIDKTHADVKGKVVAEKDFTGTGLEDVVGHGTHVASIAAGTGAASKGKYKGVAPDASLVSAKVCEEGGCTEDAILGGMKWAAVDQKARVANISLGGFDAPEVDPLEQAVEDLTKQTGILFVISAGNDGPAAETVGSPGSADSALTVGAVDKEDRIADFSSRGPRIGDGGLKPDVTAPGVDIAAAKSKDGQIGDPVPDAPQYVFLSGTSMAAPHTAGSAALLAQQHEKWKATDLKSALMGSAEPAGDLDVFDQGAGRIDAAAASKLTTYAVPGSVSFGTARWPHDDDEPVKKTVTYKNTGQEDVTLDLSASLQNAEGDPAPDGAVSLSADQVTVPAGKTAEVTVTSNTKHEGPDGTYSGTVVAESGDTRLTTPIGVNKEVESYDLTINHVDKDGKPTDQYWDLAYGVDTGVLKEPCCGSTVKLRLPKGTYVVDSPVFVGESDVALTVWSSVQVDRDVEITSDARETQPLEVEAPEPKARVAFGEVGYARRMTFVPGEEFYFSSGWWLDSLKGFTTRGADQAGPDDMIGEVSTQWGDPGAKKDFFNSPFIYNLKWLVPGSLPTGFDKAPSKDELAKVVSDQGIEVTKRTGDRTVFGFDAGHDGSASSMVWPYDLPAKVEQFHTTEGLTWRTDVTEADESGDNPFGVIQFNGRSSTYKPGKAYKEKFDRGVFGPWFPVKYAGYRQGDAIYATIPMFSDQFGHEGYSMYDKGKGRLLRNGEVVYEGEPGWVEAEDLPAGPAKFRLEASATRAKVSDYSTTVAYAWNFRSSHAKEAQLPLWGVKFAPKVDDHSILHEGPKHAVPVHVKAQPGSKAGAIEKLTVDVSADDGKTWKKGALVPTGKGKYLLVVDVPRDTDYVSLRSKVTDDKGNTAEQKIIRAYALA